MKFRILFPILFVVYKPQKIKELLELYKKSNHTNIGAFISEAITMFGLILNQIEKGDKLCFLDKNIAKITEISSPTIEYVRKKNEKK